MLPGIAAGEVVPALAFLESSDPRWSPAGVTISTLERDGQWMINGRKEFVLDGAGADVFLVVVRHAGTLALVSVKAAADGVTVTPAVTLDQTRGLATVDFDSAIVTLVAEAIDEGLDAALAAAAAMVCIESVGGAQRCLEMAVDYAKTRYQFGRAIGSYQAISHKCADMLAAVELSRSAAQYAVSAVASGDAGEAAIAVATAKAFVADAYQQVAGDNVQVHGGIGFTWEHDAHLYFKRAKSASQLFGDATEHRRRLGDLIKV